MLWPFSKRKSIPTILPLEGGWQLSQGAHGDAPMIIRANASYSEFSPVADYDHQVGIAVPLNNPTPDGFPDTNEGEQLGQIEDQLCMRLEKDAISLFVAVISTGGMREFVYYTRDPNKVKSQFEGLRREIDSHEIQLMIQPDKKWKVFHGVT